jgi:hypothetical protein
MKTITTIAALAALITLAACNDKPAPVEPTDPAVVEVPAEKTGGPCGDGTVLGENEQCK